MPKKYANLKALLADNAEASHYFSTLPEYVRDHVAARGNEVNSFGSLRSHVANATKGDD